MQKSYQLYTNHTDVGKSDKIVRIINIMITYFQ